jgi:hypothetical protein
MAKKLSGLPVKLFVLPENQSELPQKLNELPEKPKSKYPLKRDHVQQNKLRVMKNSML